MNEISLLILLWLALLLLAAPYVRRVAHPSHKGLVAYLIFVVAFSAAAFVVFAVLSTLLVLLGRGDILLTPLGTVFFLLVVFLPAFLLARRLVRRPARPAPRP